MKSSLTRACAITTITSLSLLFFYLNRELKKISPEDKQNTRENFIEMPPCVECGFYVGHQVMCSYDTSMTA